MAETRQSFVKITKNTASNHRPKDHYTALYKSTSTGWPNKNRTLLRYHIFAATTDIIIQFLLQCSEITAENNKRHFFKRVLNILCKVTGKWTTSYKTAGR